MAQINERDRMLMNLYKKSGTLMDFNYDSLQAPPLTKLMPVKDIEYMRNIATSIKYNSKVDFKRKELGKVMNYYGFVEYHSGTHRKVYRHLEIPTICAKLAFNKSSLSDSILEYKNSQLYLRPACTKVFEVDPTGFIGLFERVDPVSSKEEFASMGNDIWMLLEIITSMYIVDDIGTDSFMNWGIRKFGNCAGPVLLDFPEVYPIDGNNMYCIRPLDNFGRRCTGKIVYDAGFNSLHCDKCGCPYNARELKKAVDNHDVIMKGWSKNMKILLKRGDKVIDVIDNQVTDTIEPPKKEHSNPMEMNIGSNIKFNPKTKKKKKQPQKVKSDAKFYGTTDKSPTMHVGDKISAAYGGKSGTFIERYKCECGKFYGKKNTDKVCRYCNTKVKYRDPEEYPEGFEMKPIEYKSEKQEDPDFRYRCQCEETFGKEKEGSFCKKCYTRVVFHDEPKEELNDWVDDAMNEPIEDEPVEEVVETKEEPAYEVHTEEETVDWKEVAINPEDTEENPVELPANGAILTEEQKKKCDEMLKMWQENTEQFIDQESIKENETVYSDEESAPTLGDYIPELNINNNEEDSGEAVTFNTQSPLLSEGNAFYNM